LCALITPCPNLTLHSENIDGALVLASNFVAGYVNCSLPSPSLCHGFPRLELLEKMEAHEEGKTYV
jgi:hypothetical protein